MLQINTRQLEARRLAFLAAKNEVCSEHGSVWGCPWGGREKENSKKMAMAIAEARARPYLLALLANEAALKTK